MSSDIFFLSNAFKSFNKDNIFKRVQNKIVEKIEPQNPMLGWFSNYLIFGLAIYVCKNLLKPLLDIPSLPIIGTHWVGGIVGAVLQGKATCVAQKNLENRHPYIAPVIGFFNGAMCCYAMSIMAAVLSATPPGAAIISAIPIINIPQLLSVAITSAIASKIMCKIEFMAGGFADKYFPVKEDIGTRVTNQPNLDQTEAPAAPKAEHSIKVLSSPEIKSCCCRNHVAKVTDMRLDAGYVGR